MVKNFKAEIDKISAKKSIEKNSVDEKLKTITQENYEVYITKHNYNLPYYGIEKNVTDDVIINYISRNSDAKTFEITMAEIEEKSSDYFNNTSNYEFSYSDENKIITIEIHPVYDSKMVGDIIADLNAGCGRYSYDLRVERAHVIFQGFEVYKVEQALLNEKGEHKKNKIILQFIKQSSELIELNENHVKRDPSKNFRIAEIRCKSQCYLTEASFKSLNNILNNPAKFNKLTLKEKVKKQMELDQLNKDEYVFVKSVIKKTVHDSTLCSDLYPEKYLFFKDAITEFVFPSANITVKANQKFLLFKVQMLVRKLIGELMELGHTVFKPVADLSDDELRDIFHKNIDISWIFNEICEIVLKKAQDNRFNSIMRNTSMSQDVVTNDILAANVYDVEDEFRIVFVMYLLNIVLNYLSSKKGNEFDYQSLEKIVFRYLRKETPLAVGASEWWNSYKDGVRSIIFAFRDCGIFQLDTKTCKISWSPSIKTTQKFIVPFHLMNYSVPYMKFPTIFQLESINVDTFNSMIKPIFKGDVKISFSSKFEHTLNISKNKKYKINPTYLMLLSNLFRLNENSMYRDAFRNAPLPFPFEDELYDNLNSSLIQARRMSATILRLAECYEGFPIFINYSLCARGKYYPEQQLIPRTSGCFKYLLQEYSERKITGRGFVILLEAYYKSRPDYQKALSEFIKSTNWSLFSKQHGIELLADFFHAHPLDFTKISNKQFSYFMLLHAEILKAIKTGHTGVMIEIGQVASGVTLLSYLIRNKKMARVCNGVGGAASDPYEYCMLKFKDFYETQFIEKFNTVFEFLCNDREIHEYAVICFVYRKTYYGRRDYFVSRFEDAFKRSVSNEEIKVLYEFAKKYDDYMHFVFPKTKIQIDLLLKTIDIAVKELGYFPFKNLQGETFKWSFYEYKTTTRSAYDPISHKANHVKIHKAYKSQEVKFESFKNSDGEIKNRLKCDYRISKRQALSYIIDCIEASLIHRFIYRMHKVHKYSITHLHDCMLVHPNYVDAMYKIIKETYKSDELYYMANHLFFDHIANHVDEHTKSIIEKYKREFETNCDDFADELKNVNVRNLYIHSR